MDDVPLAAHREALHVKRDQRAANQLKAKRLPGEQGHTQSCRHALLEGGAVAQLHGHDRAQAMIGEETLGVRACARALLAHEHGVGGQLGKGEMPAAGQRMCGRGRDDELVVHEVGHVHVVHVLGRAKHRQVHATAAQQLHRPRPVDHVEGQGDAGIDAVEAAEDRG